MKYNFQTMMFGWFYHTACKKEYKKKFDSSGRVSKRVMTEYKNVILRAKDIGNSKLMSAYCMAAYFIAMNCCTGLSPEENYEMFKDEEYCKMVNQCIPWFPRNMENKWGGK